MCIGSSTEILQPSDPGFREEVSQKLGPVESWMLERLVQLKRRLRNVTTYDFWQVLMEGMTEVTGSQYAFVAKRVLYADDGTAVEMPPIGEPGSCLMGLAFYFNDRKGKSCLFRDYKYQVYGCPCQWMRHDRVLLIPDGLTVLTPDNPNAQGFPIPAEGYLAIPLFHDGNCFAHFGCLWTADGLKERPKLTWGMVEMFLHALEDQVAARIMEGLGLGNNKAKNEVLPQNLVTGAVAVKHSLRPYARRLSHELRTPMQGVVGMLDVMYASVLEAIHPDRWHLTDLDQLKDIIEADDLNSGLDSSKRAVDAADNMVHAYDFNMEVPVTPSQGKEIPDILGLEDRSGPFGFDYCNTVKDDDSHRRNFKRRRSSVTSGRDSPHKIPHIEPPDSPIPMVVEPEYQLQTRNPSLGVVASDIQPHHQGLSPADAGTSSKSECASDYFSLNAGSGQTHPGTPGLYYDAVGKVVLNSRPLKLRELLHEAVHESLRTGGRPDFTKITETPRGERVIVEVAEAGSVEEERKLVEIEVIVDETVPESMIIDGSYLMKMISSVFHNAFKFTPSGRITLKASVNSSRQIIFSIVDTGGGIPSDFIPDLFKPFTTEDESLTRHRDGLGLGLYVAKGIARKMGGDLWCERTATEGDNRGSEFRIRLPITPADASGSTPGTPSPTPLDTTGSSLRLDTAPALRPRPKSPLKKSVVTAPPVERKLSFDPELAKKLPLRILVVEDNRINRALLCSMLKRLGYMDIEEARDGVEAVEIFTASLFSSLGGTKRAFDLVLMDLWMPRMDGYEAAERIVKLYNDKRNNSGESAPLDDGITVLAVSADATEEARAKAALKGMHGFVGKPFGIADLGKAVMDFRGKDVVSGEQQLSTPPTPVK
ncbi:hypothetical protein BDD12DRAFT_918435 [Trichophaea hybrida]|nr:hypothetical protein BDD12DRAFT_918435 [Trichophaea hybrida]